MPGSGPRELVGRPDAETPNSRARLPHGQPGVAVPPDAIGKRRVAGNVGRMKDRHGPAGLAAPGHRLVRLEGFEPTTRGLRIRCAVCLTHQQATTYRIATPPGARIGARSESPERHPTPSS